jgi:hypothetical protein
VISFVARCAPRQSSSGEVRPVASDDAADFVINGADVVQGFDLLTDPFILARIQRRVALNFSAMMLMSSNRW